MGKNTKKPRRPQAREAAPLRPEDILVEDNRFTPYGALEEDPPRSIPGAPVNPVGKIG
jgi:hypothetical protein